MFFLFCILSALGDALQSTLMVSYYRRLDPLSSITFRSLALGISMLPLLLFTNPSDFVGLLHHWQPIALAGLLTALGYWSRVKAYRCLPVGIAIALCVGLGSLILIGVGVLFFEEALSQGELILAVSLVGVITLLGLSKSEGRLPAEYNSMAGLIYSIISAALVAASFALVTFVSRQIHPFLTAYSWEVSIAICGITIAVLREIFGGPRFTRLTWDDAKGIFICTLPAIMGIGLFVYAVSFGSLALAGAIVSTNVVMSTLIAYLLYKELPTRWQWFLILLVTVLLACLELAKVP